MSFKHVSSRHIAATIGVLAAGVAFFVPLPMSASSESACEAMARWAAEYERTTPAPTLDELATFDRGRREALFNAVSAEVKASLFQEQLRRFSQRPDLTDAQRTLIAEGLTLITPALYRKDPAASQSLRLFWSRAEPSFASPDQRRLWTDVGSIAAFTDHVVPGLNKYTSAARTGDGCQCSISQQDCGSWSCVSGSCTQGSGCGSGGAYTCNGICVPLIPSASLTASR